jgi:hypothetical protein
MEFSVHHKCLPPEELESALKSLPPEVQALARLPMIKFLSWGHPKVPPDLKGQAIRDTFFGQIESLCITDQNRETISVILGRFEDLNLEMIHVAQITQIAMFKTDFSTPYAMRERPSSQSSSEWNACVNRRSL